MTRLRWRYLLVCVGLAIIALLSSLTVALFLPQPGGEEQFATVNEFTERTVAFLLIILLLTPLQAAGEEYVFRGYFTQAFGSLVAGVWLSRVIAVTVPALLFALAHGVQEAPVFFDRFAFGVVSGVLVLVTGGLEAGIAMHVLNNFFAFGIALAFGDMTEALNATAPSSWWMILTTLTQSMVYLGLAVWVARAMKLDNRGPSVGKRFGRAQVARVEFFLGPNPLYVRGRRPNTSKTVGYGVIGNTTGSGPVILGSSPSIPARLALLSADFPEPGSLLRLEFHSLRCLR